MHARDAHATGGCRIHEQDAHGAVGFLAHGRDARATGGPHSRAGRPCCLGYLNQIIVCPIISVVGVLELGQFKAAEGGPIPQPSPAGWVTGSMSRQGLKGRNSQSSVPDVPFATGDLIADE